MPKYVIDIPDDTTCINVLKYEDSKCVAARSYIIPDLTPYTESDRKADTEDDVWEFVMKCLKMDGNDFYEIFGSCDALCLTNLSYQEAKEKYEAWRKQKDEIRVGDEVVYADDPNKEKAIVLRLYQPKQYKTLADILCEDGTVVKMVVVENLAWTGRHFPEVEDLLEKMKEGDQT